jgi:hypothetical protein
MSRFRRSPRKLYLNGAQTTPPLPVFPSFARSWNASSNSDQPLATYYPEPAKSILVVKEANKAAATEYFADLGFTVVTGHRYLGGFLGANEDLQAWLKDKAVGRK